MVTYTTRLNLELPDFDVATWHDEVNGNFQILDAAYGTLTITGEWLNSTAYAINDRVVDLENSTFYICQVNHTSAAAPTTFAADRTANPTYWDAIPQVQDFLQLGDLSTPSYVGLAGGVIRVNPGETGIEITNPATDALRFDTIELGHASDTTLARLSAGDITIEGNLIYRAAGTDIPITDGGTGASDAGTARSNLGLGTIATQADNNVAITGGSITGITDLAVVDGGTGASNAAGAKTNLGFITDVIDDTTPQLGSDLDTNAHHILFDSFYGIKDDSGNEQLLFQSVASAVNFLQIKNAATGNGAELLAAGSDTDIDINVIAKGDGEIILTGHRPGEFFWFAGTTVPSYALECDGSAVSRTTYARLFAKIGTTHGVGDGSTTFNLPDLHTNNRFIRGADGTTISVGGTQTDAIAQHSHGYYYDRTTNNRNDGSAGRIDRASSGSNSGSSTTNTGGSETRPNNIALMPCIVF